MSLHLYNADQAHKPGLEDENILPLYISAIKQEKQNNTKWCGFDNAPLVDLLIIEKQNF